MLVLNDTLRALKVAKGIVLKVAKGIVQNKLQKRWPQLCRALRRSRFTTRFVEFSGISVVIKC